MTSALTSTHGGKNPEDAISIIDVKIEKTDISQTDELLRLRRLRNTYSFISRLSDDVLLEIFIWIHFSTPNFRSFLLSKNILPPAFPLSHVCNRWRQISFSSSTLWTRINTGWGDLVSCFIERSNTLPLRIRHERQPSSTGAADDIYPELIPKNSHRLQLLHLSGRISGLFKQLASLPAPKLHYLLLDQDISSPDESSSEFADISIDSKTFDGFAPELRYCKISGYNVSWKNPPASIFQNLESLCLDRLKPTPNLKELLGFLSECQQLTELSMTRFSISKEGNDQLNLQKETVSFPNLGILQLNLEARSTPHLIRRLETSEYAAWYIKYEVVDMTRPFHYNFFRPTPCKRVILRCNEDYLSIEAVDSSKHSGSPWTTFEFRYGEKQKSAWAIFCFLSKIFKDKFWNRAECLIVKFKSNDRNFLSSVDEDAWINILLSLPYLKRIHLSSVDEYDRDLVFNLHWAVKIIDIGEYIVGTPENPMSRYSPEISLSFRK